MAIAKYIPCLRPILRITRKDSKSYSSYQSSRRSTVTSHCSQTSELSGHPKLKGRLPSVSDSESVRKFKYTICAVYSVIYSHTSSRAYKPVATKLSPQDPMCVDVFYTSRIVLVTCVREQYF